MSSATADEGQPVQLAVSDDIVIDGPTVIPRDSVVNGTVVQSVAKRRMGRTGKLDFSIDNIVAPDGGKVPVRYSVMKKEGGSHATGTGIITAGVAILFWLAAPFVPLRKGKDTVYRKGMSFDVFTDAAYGAKPRRTEMTAVPKAPAKAPNKLAMTNEDIVKLKRSGFSDELLQSTIRASPADYTLDAESMIQLKTSGLSDAVIGEMMKRRVE